MAPDIKILKAFIGIAPQSKIHKEPFTVIISPWTVHVKSNWFTYTVHLYNFVNCDVKSFWNCSWSMSSYLSGVLWGIDAQIRAAQFLGIGATFLMRCSTQLLSLQVTSDRSVFWPLTQNMGRQHPFFTLRIPEEKSLKMFTLWDYQIYVVLTGLSNLTDKNPIV